MMPTLFKALATGAICLAATGGVYAQTSTFLAGSEGWTALGDAAGPLSWVAAGGHPDGHVAIADAVLDGITYFVAPSLFLGNKSGAIGTSLGFDLQQVYSEAANQFNNSDVVLIGDGITIAYDTAVNPANGAWTSYSVPLNSAGWHLGTLDGASITDAQFLRVMSNLTALRIRAEYQTGPDTGKLDNVTLAVPEPATYLLFAIGSVCLWLFGRPSKG